MPHSDIYISHEPGWLADDFASLRHGFEIHVDGRVIDNLAQSEQSAQAEQELAKLRDMYHLDEGPVKNYFRWTGLLWFGTGDHRGALVRKKT